MLVFKCASISVVSNASVIPNPAIVVGLPVISAHAVEPPPPPVTVVNVRPPLPSVVNT